MTRATIGENAANCLPRQSVIADQNDHGIVQCFVAGICAAGDAGGCGCARMAMRGAQASC